MERSPSMYEGSSSSRQSRIPVKDSHKKKRCSRSSSNLIRRVPSSSHLMIPQACSSNIRAKSCVNLEALCTTPLINSRSSSSIRTPLSGSKYSCMNTDFLNSQFSRVKRYFREKDPTIQALKPLTMAVYVQTMQLLWKEIDPRIEINPKKIDGIGEYLKMFKFPAQIKMSALKNPSVPHNFQYVLSIWVWLLDEIEAIRSMSDLERPEKHSIAFKFFVGRFKHMPNEKNGESEKINTEYHQNCKQFLFKKKGIPIKSYEEVQQEEMKLQHVVQEAKQKFVALESRHNEMQRKNNEIELRHSEAIHANKQLEKDLEEYQNKHIKSLEEENRLKEALNNQPCSLVEWTKMRDEHQLLTIKLDLKNKQENENKELSSQIDMELMDVKSKMINVIENINSTIIRNLKYMPEMQEFLIPQKGHFNENMSQIIINMKEKLGEVEDRIRRDQERLNNLVKKINDKIELEEQLETLKKQLDEQMCINKELEYKKNEINNNHHKQIKEMQVLIENKQKQNVEYLKKLENLQQNIVAHEENIEKLSKREETLSNVRNENQKCSISFLNEFLEKMSKAALEEVSAVTEARAAANEALETMSKNLDASIKVLEEFDK